MLISLNATNIPNNSKTMAIPTATSSIDNLDDGRRDYVTVYWRGTPRHAALSLNFPESSCF